MNLKVGNHIFEFKVATRRYHAILYESVLFSKSVFYIYVVPATLLRYVDSPGALSKHSVCTIIEDQTGYRVLKSSIDFPASLWSELSNLVEVSHVQRM
jgi:hypothetical protein